MSNELREEIRGVRTLVEKILHVLKIVNAEKIQKTKESLLRSDMKRKIYELCDGRHTVKDMTSRLKTTPPNVSYHLSTLLESGFVRYEDIAGKRFYSKTLE
ncbi:MAG: ArsR/SmtB family transcription factor [Thermoplasmata archaeon]